MSENGCKNCAYFQQHYTFGKRHILRVYCGHCTFSKVRKKLPDSKICGNFIPAGPDDCAFVTKEYLSKKILQYLLRLELLPEIRDIEETDR